MQPFIAKPKLGVGYHYFLDDDTVDAMYELLWKTSDIPMVLAQDLTVINITPEQIVTRQAETNLLHWTPPGPQEEGPPQLDPKSPGTTPQFVVDTMVNFVRALLWPMYIVMLWPPAGAIGLAVAFVLFPRYLKKPIIDPEKYHRNQSDDQRSTASGHRVDLA